MESTEVSGSLGLTLVADEELLSLPQPLKPKAKAAIAASDRKFAGFM
jgi:hypothetical protein